LAIEIVSGNLFETPNRYFSAGEGKVYPFWLAQCVSADYAFGHGKNGKTWGIAFDFDTGSVAAEAATCP
jgi:hypothetical protein